MKQLPVEKIFPFPLDTFQKQAIQGFLDGNSVVVSAPTGSGKTVIAEAAIQSMSAIGKKSFYTTPIKALSNQKYRDLRETYGSKSVGLLTGDVTHNSNAPITVMTTEVLRNIMYTDVASLDDLGVVILDEVHFLQDSVRGPIWEEIIIHLPVHIRFICLSATISNVQEIADWIASIRGKTLAISESKRPIELTNFYMVKDKPSRSIRTVETLIHGKPNKKGSVYDRSQKNHYGGHNSYGKHRSTSRYIAPRRFEVLEYLAQNKLLPAIYFLFSRAACDDAVQQCLDFGFCFTHDDAQREIKNIIYKHCENIAPEDLQVIGFSKWREGLIAGIASHHAGLLPALKEVVEECFVRGLIHIVFATETLAMGINMPARSVVIEKPTKFTGEHHVLLTPGQYTQLTGRAGRRGIDVQGTAICLWSPFVLFNEVAQLAASKEFYLTSAFRPTYNMTIQLLQRYEKKQISFLLEKSLAQFQSSRDIIQLQKQISNIADVQSVRSQKKIKRLQKQIHEKEHSLSNTFEKIVSVLESSNFIKENKILPRGELLRKIFHECDILIVYALENGLLDRLDPPTLAGVVSWFVYEKRNKSQEDKTPWYPNKDIKRRIKNIEEFAETLQRKESNIGLPVTRIGDPGFFYMTYSWAAGQDFHQVLHKQSFSGGDFVRTMKQVSDLLRQISVAANDPLTRSNAKLATNAVYRGVVATNSLEFDREIFPVDEVLDEDNETVIDQEKVTEGDGTHDD